MRSQSCCISAISSSIVDAKLLYIITLSIPSQIFYMKIKLDHQNFLRLHPHSGRIQELHLAGKTVLLQVDEGTGSGNFLMFPWVNRVEQNPFLPVQSQYFDGNGIPLHGLYVNDQRQITVSTSQNAIIVELVAQKVVEGVPKFRQRYILSRGKLSVEIFVDKSENVLPFCFGYHPYLQIDNEDLKDLELTTDISIQLKLQENLLPVFPYQPSPVVISSGNKYDSLFQGGSYLRVKSKTGFNVEIKSHLPYWQIYTPPDGKKIAVEPMSFTANVYKISEKGLSPALTQGEFSISAWHSQE